MYVKATSGLESTPGKHGKVHWPPRCNLKTVENGVKTTHNQPDNQSMDQSINIKKLPKLKAFADDDSNVVAQIV